MSVNKAYKNSLVSKLTEEQVRRQGGFSKKGVKVIIGRKTIESLTMLDGDKERRREKKDGIADRDERGLFVTTRNDLCKSIKQPKKNAGNKVRKKENIDTVIITQAERFECAKVQAGGGKTYQENLRDSKRSGRDTNKQKNSNYNKRRK